MGTSIRRRAAGAVLTGMFALGGLAACAGDDGSGGTAAASTTVPASTTSAAGGTAMGDTLVAALGAMADGDCTGAEEAVSDLPLGGDRLAGLQAVLGNPGETGEALQRVADEGPPEIRADAGVLAAAFEDVARAAAELGLDRPGSLTSIMADPTRMAELERLGAAVQGEQVTGAVGRISSWMTERCPGIAGG